MYYREILKDCEIEQLNLETINDSENEKLSSLKKMKFKNIFCSFKHFLWNCFVIHEIFFWPCNDAQPKLYL